MSSIFVWLQIIFCSWVNKTKLSSFLRLLLRENGRSLRFPKIFIKKKKLCDRMIKQWLNSVIAKYRDFVSVSQINYLPLLTTDTGLKITLTAGRRTWSLAKYFLARTNPDSGWSNNEYYSFFLPKQYRITLAIHCDYYIDIHIFGSKLVKNAFRQIVEFLSVVFACFNVRSTLSIIVGSVWSL